MTLLDKKQKESSPISLMQTTVEYSVVLAVLAFTAYIVFHTLSGPVTSVFSQLNSGFQNR